MDTWIKEGLIYAPPGEGWMNSHAQNPMPEWLSKDLLRIHFATRDQKNRARGGYIDLDPSDLFTVINESKTPTLDLGDLGTFDDSGVMPSALVDVGSERYLYYTGWAPAVTVPFSFHIGLAISKDGGKSYQRYSKAPVIGRTHYDPYIVGAPYVLLEDGVFRMWYISCTGWEKDNEDDKPKHYYTIKYAESKNGIDWNTSDKLTIPYQKDEYAIARPVVFKHEGQYHMWFSYRGGENTYNVGMATSPDGNDWTRDPEIFKLEGEESEWDAGMTCYPHPLVLGDQLYMLYNGNDYGRTGIGLARKA